MGLISRFALKVLKLPEHETAFASGQRYSASVLGKRRGVYAFNSTLAAVADAERSIIPGDAPDGETGVSRQSGQHDESKC